MTHDPLFFSHDDFCPEIIDPGGPEMCQCDLIARVREDERSKHNAEHTDDRFAAFQNGYAAALRDAKAAIERRWEKEPDAASDWLLIAMHEIDALGKEQS